VIDVVIVGAGPTGLMLACELALRQVRVVVLERNVVRPEFVRSFNLNPRSLEMLDRRGIADRFLADGWKVPFAGFAGVEAPLDLSVLSTDHPYMLGIPQTRTEELLEARANELGAEIRRGQEVIGLSQTDDGVEVQVQSAPGASTLRGDHQTVCVRYLVGCDGGRSTVRKLAGIDFPGTPARRYALLGDVVVDAASLPVGNHVTERGSVFVIPRPGYVRVITRELRRPAERDAPVTLAELTEAVRHVLGRDVAFAQPRWLTRFGDAARLAECFRSGRIFLAGDAAHIHPPAGSQGLNVGLQDAFNLGWKLAAELHGWAPPSLLDSYHAERHAAGERLLVHTRAQAELGSTDPERAPVRTLFREIARMEPVRKHLAEMATGLDTRYLGETERADAVHPWLGKLAPNLSVERGEEITSIAVSLSGGGALLLVGRARRDLFAHAEPWRDRLTMASVSGASMMGWFADVDAALIRPDGHIAWLSAGGDQCARGMHESMTRWLGAPREWERASVSPVIPLERA
jgi:2-polyprenyl-6-methoxyphenol hydroxylase-like FAD-dependent oxidoreductase